MNEQITKITLKDANEYYDAAQEELCRPEEDLVPYKICRSAYKSVGNYLAAYLFNHGFEVRDEMTLEFLLEKSISFDPKFEVLDLKPLFYGNAHHEEVIHATAETMQVYLGIAEQTRDLVIELLD